MNRVLKCRKRPWNRLLIHSNPSCSTKKHTKGQTRVLINARGKFSLLGKTECQLIFFTTQDLCMLMELRHHILMFRSSFTNYYCSKFRPVFIFRMFPLLFIVFDNFELANSTKFSEKNSSETLETLPPQNMENKPACTKTRTKSQQHIDGICNRFRPY